MQYSRVLGGCHEGRLDQGRRQGGHRGRKCAWSISNHGYSSSNLSTDLVQCIGEAFGVDVANEAQKQQLSVKPANLQQIFDVYLKTEAKRKGSGAAPAANEVCFTSILSCGTVPNNGTCSQTPAMSSSSPKQQASAADVAAADKLKGEGNSLMAAKKYPEAIAKYGEAIRKNPSNPVYYSNRAAAHSQAGDHQKAIDDAEQAKSLDPNFTKAYSRLGCVSVKLRKTIC